MEKMKGETIEKPPPLLLPPSKHEDIRHSSFVDKEKFLEERVVQKFTARYDAFQGILKRVSEMKLSGSLDSEEPSACSERSESSTSGQPTRFFQNRNSFADSSSHGGTFEDESSASSITGSDPCPPYEGIPRDGCRNRYSCGSLPSYPTCVQTEVSSISFPPPPSPTELYKSVSVRNSPTEYKRKEVTRRRNLETGGGLARSAAGVDDGSTNALERRLSSERGGQPEGISESEKHQLEMFFKSLKTDVYVCGSLANLYLGWKEGEGNWTYRHTGVVVVVFDSGDTRCRNKRKIQILLAERGSCFPLWKDTIDNLSSYHKSGTAFHTMHLSCDHRQMAGLSFDSASEAERLLGHLEELTSNPENINISAPGSRKKKRIRSKGRVAPLPHKKDISNPCLFQHVTSVVAKDKPIYLSMQTLIDMENMKKAENMC